jgi:hypothetical protein
MIDKMCRGPRPTGQLQEETREKPEYDHGDAQQHADAGVERFARHRITARKTDRAHQ